VAIRQVFKMVLNLMKALNQVIARTLEPVYQSGDLLQCGNIHRPAFTGCSFAGVMSVEVFHEE